MAANESKGAAPVGGHTPGPWVASGCTVLVDSPPQFIATVGAPSSRGDADLANARLIAAAPDSHDANVKFVEAIECLCGITPAWSDDRIYDELPSSGLAVAYLTARAALAKVASNGDTK